MIREEFEQFLETGKDFLRKRDFREAIINFELALERAYMLGSDRDAMIVNEYLGKAFMESRDYKKSLEYYENNLMLHEDMQNIKGVISTLNKIGLIYAASGNYDRAIQYYLKSLEVAKENGEHEAEATVLRNLGIIYNKLGLNVLALKAHTASLNIKRKMGDRRGEAMTLLNIAQSQIDTGEYGKARENLEKALVLCNKLGLKKEKKKVQDELDLLDELEAEMDLELAVVDRFIDIDANDFVRYKRWEIG
ncbi:MAG: tetratricopeptide repeat protein [Promethearchaeota archaeon]